MFNFLFLYSLRIKNNKAACHWQVLTTLIPLLGVELLVSSENYTFIAYRKLASIIIKNGNWLIEAEIYLPEYVS
jgi:hypothetical protein